MNAKVLYPRSVFKAVAGTILCLCILFLNTTAVRAQKEPSIFKSDYSAYIKSLEKEYENVEASDKDKAKLLRNKLIYIGVEQIDSVFSDYRKKSRNRNAVLQIIFDLLEIGASTAAAITNGERAKEVIAEALTGFKGARTSFNKNLRLLEAQILFNKMVANRSQKLGSIYEKLNDDVVSYPWVRARSELLNYLIAGTIDDALNSLSIETGSVADDSQRDLKDIMKKAGVLTAPTEEDIFNSKKNAGAIDALVGAYSNAEKKVAEADSKIADASRKIADANKRITDENVKPDPDQNVIARANQDKASADGEKTQAVTSKEEATRAKAEALSSLKATFKAIEGDEILSPLLDEIPGLPGYSADYRSRLQESLKRLRENNETVEDYPLIMLQVGKLVRMNLSKSPVMNQRLQTILKVNK